MNKNAITRVAAVAAAVVAMAPSSSQAMIPEVSDVTMTQSATRRVTVTYRLSDAPAVVTLDIQTNANTSAAADDPGWTSIGGKNICNAQGDVWKKVSGKDTYTITWQPDQIWTDAEGEGFKIAANGARARVTAWPVDNTPNYMVVDISAGAQPNTQTYYPTADFVPGGVTNSLYKTTTLLMRKIMAKDVTWTMGSTTLETLNREAREATHQVKLENNYYIGVYEVTQSQWSQVATNSTISANFTNERSMRPMEKVSYNEIRNSANSTSANASYNWPNAPNPSSFLGLIRSKTGLDFDLPSESQWEFAARAGNGSGYWNDGSAILNATPDANLNLLGRYERNGGRVLSGTSYVDPAASCGVTNGTAIVGSYAPNAWGLYDMHGNVVEWCLDWLEADISAYGGRVNINTSDPAKTLSGVSGMARVPRGGCWSNGAGNCRPARRFGFGAGDRNSLIGFRVVCTAGLQ